MGYTTDFEGRFELDTPLSAVQTDYLTKFAETRRMQRDVSKLPIVIDNNVVTTKEGMTVYR